MNVLSLFDGMSCGQIALTELGCFPEKCYASEVDKFAIQQTTHVFPDTIQLGDVTKVDVSKLDKIDLLIGGSLCQSFSFAGKRVGMVTTDKVDITDLQTYLDLKEMGFEFEGQSYLFWEYMRILTDIRKYNLNVKVPARKREDVEEVGNSVNQGYRSGRPDCLTTVQRANLLQFRGMLRRLTPTECVRLQTVPEWYEWVVSDTQIYRMCGNGWTVKVIEHILENLFI